MPLPESPRITPFAPPIPPIAEFLPPVLLLRILLLVESFLLLPLSGIVYPLVVVFYSIYTVVKTVVAYNLLEGGERSDKKRAILDQHKQAMITRAFSRSRPTSPSPDPPPPPPNNCLELTIRRSKSGQLFTPPATLQTDISEMVITTSAFLFPPTPVRPRPKNVPTRSPSPPAPPSPSTLTLLIEDPAYVFDSVLSKRRTIFTLSLTCLYASRTFLNVMVGATLVKKYLILLSVTLPSICEQYDLLFSSRSSFSRLAMTSFTIHALTFIVLVLSVCYEAPPPYLYLTTLFDFCYSNIFPVGVIISILEGWRVGSLPPSYNVAWEDRLKEKKLSPPPVPPVPLEPPSETRSDAATCASSHLELNEHEEAHHDDDQLQDHNVGHDYENDVDDEDHDVPLESVDEVSICASTSSTIKRWNGEDEGEDEVDVDADVDGDGEVDGVDVDRGGGLCGEFEGDGDNLLKNLNYPIRPVQVDEFLHNQQQDDNYDNDDEDDSRGQAPSENTSEGGNNS